MPSESERAHDRMLNACGEGERVMLFGLSRAMRVVLAKERHHNGAHQASFRVEQMTGQPRQGLPLRWNPLFLSQGDWDDAYGEAVEGLHQSQQELARRMRKRRGIT